MPCCDSSSPSDLVPGSFSIDSVCLRGGGGGGSVNTIIGLISAARVVYFVLFFSYLLNRPQFGYVFESLHVLVVEARRNPDYRAYYHSQCCQLNVVVSFSIFSFFPMFGIPA